MTSEVSFARPLLAAGLAAVLVLPGCVGVVAADATRKESLSAISRVLSEQRPDLPPGSAECVFGAMSYYEIGQLGIADNYKTISTENRNKILAYAARPAAQTCIAGLPRAAS